MVRMSRVNKAWRLLTVDGLLQVSVKKGVLHVHLVDRPTPGSGDAEDDADHRRLDDRVERLIVVDAVALSEAANNPASLVTGKRTIGVEFMLINPLAVTTFAPGDRGTRRQVLLSMRAWYSSAMAARHWGSARCMVEMVD